MKKLEGKLLPPKKHENVPTTSKWLSGQGEGTWFCVTKEESLREEEYRVRRISPQGNLDCDRIFTLNKFDNVFNFDDSWDVLHISHCAIVRIKQSDFVFEMHFAREF